MFPLTRPIRQVSATVALVVLTVAPTIYVTMTAWRIGRPEHRREVETEIGRILGLQVTLDAVRYPRPGEVEYHGVVFRQEEPRGKGLMELARASVVRLRRGDRELMLEAGGLTIRADSPRAAMAQVGVLLQRSGDSTYERVSLSAPDCLLDLGAGVPSYRLREVVGQFVADRSAPTVRASYRVVADPKGTGPGTRCELTLTRDRKAEPVRTSLTLKTMEGLPLPARVLDPFFDAVDWLGPDARADGVLSLRQEGSNEWEVDFQGNLHDIDLAELMNRRFPSHRLRGKARLAIHSARWAERPGQGFGWVEATGELTAGPGMIGYGLLQALKTEMRFRPSQRVVRAVSAGQVDLDFRALAFTFAMTSNGEIKVGGAMGNEFDPDVILVSASDPLAYAPQGAANVRGLIKTLVPVTAINRAAMVPLTERSRILLSLPVPPDAVHKRIKGN